MLHGMLEGTFFLLLSPFECRVSKETGWNRKCIVPPVCCISPGRRLYKRIILKLIILKAVMYRRLGGPQGRCGISFPTRIRSAGRPAPWEDADVFLLANLKVMFESDYGVNLKCV